MEKSKDSKYVQTQLSQKLYKKLKLKLAKRQIYKLSKGLAIVVQEFTSDISDAEVEGALMP